MRQGAHTCKVSRKYSNAFLSYSAKTKRDGRTDGQTDRQTDGRGVLQYLPSQASGAAGDKKTFCLKFNSGYAMMVNHKWQDHNAK